MFVPVIFIYMYIAYLRGLTSIFDPIFDTQITSDQLVGGNLFSDIQQMTILIIREEMSNI